MKLVDLGPGSVPRKIAAIICLAFCGLAIPITLFRMFLGYTTMGLGIAILIIAAVIAAGMIYLLQPAKDPE